MGVANPGKIHLPMIAMRLSLIVATLALAPFVVAAASRSLHVAGWLYFLSCDPLPPAESKIRQWWNALRMKPVPVLN